MQTLTIGLATNSRPISLEKCLQSIVDNSVQPKEVVIIDNSSDKNARKIINGYRAVLNIKYVFEPQKGTSYVRNAILQNASSQILAFVDDDVILTKNYIKSILLLHKRHPKVAAIQGKSKSLPENSFLAQLLHSEYMSWIRKKRRGKYLSILDTKNTSVKLSCLKRLKFRFDPIFARFNKGEDVDLAMFLLSKNQTIIYCKEVCNFHYENTNILEIVRRRFEAGRARWHLEKKWGKALQNNSNTVDYEDLNLMQIFFIYLLIKAPYYIGRVCEELFLSQN